MIELAEFKADYNWREAFSIAGGNVDDVEHVYASDDGENDGPEWICVVRLKDGRHAVLRAGCDYTGWDCQAGGNIEYYDSLVQALSKNTLNKEERGRLCDDIIHLGVSLDW